MIIGVLCGSFSPPTIAHVNLSQACITQGLCDKIIWVPSNDAYKKSTNIKASHRCEMSRLATKDHENIVVSDHELKHETTISTFDSLKQIQLMYPGDTIRFIFGADKLHYRWIQKEALITSFEFILIPRDNIDISAIIQSSATLSRYVDRIHMVQYDEEISSTKVRDQLYHTGYSNLINAAVLKYIRTNKCYPLQDYLFCPECHRPITEGKCFNPLCILGYPIDMFYQNNIKDH